MKPVIIIAIAFALFIPSIVFAESEFSKINLGYNVWQLEVDEKQNRLFFIGATKTLFSADINGNEYSNFQSIQFYGNMIGFDHNAVTQKIYLFDQSTKNISIIDSTSLQIIDEIEDDFEPNPGSKIRQRDILVNDNTNKIYLLLESYVDISGRPQDDQKYKIRVFDGVTNNLIKEIELNSTVDFLLQDKSRNLIYAIDWIHQQYFVIDDNENFDTVRIPANSQQFVFSFVLDEKNNQIFVGLGDRNGRMQEIIVIDSISGNEIQKITDPLILNGYPPIISEKHNVIFFKTISGADHGLVVMNVNQRENQIVNILDIPESDLGYLWLVDNTNDKLYGRINDGFVVYDITSLLNESQSELLFQYKAKDLQIPAQFVDLNKGTDYYLDRYYNEPEYKIWFDENYPYLKIEEAIGLIEPYSQTKQKWQQCEATARERHNNLIKSHILSGGSVIGAEIQVGSMDNLLVTCAENYLVQLNDVGVILADMGQHEEAIEYYDKALDLYSIYAVALTNKASSLVEVGEVDEAILLYDKAIEIWPENEDIKSIRDYAMGQIPNESGIICGAGTIDQNGLCVPIQTKSQEQSKGGGCLIATATYGSELAPQVQQLRELRDNKLLTTESGTNFINSFNDFYYSFSPIIADYERKNPVFKEMVKIAITPMISSLSILNYVDMDSEIEVLGYGISLILLNVGMYFGVPVIVIYHIRKIITYG